MGDPRASAAYSAAPAVPRPVLQALVAISLLSFMDAVIKGLVVRLPVVEIAFLRYVVGSLIMAVIVAGARPPRPSGETLRANAIRAVLVVITATSFFYALGALPLAEALILSFVSPIFTAIFATWLLGERMDRRVLVALAAGFGGVVLVVSGGLAKGADGAVASSSLLGVAAVIISAVGYSSSNVLLRARAQRDPVVVIVIIQNVAPALMLLGPAILVWVSPSGFDWAMIGAIGVFGVAGHLLLARAYAQAEAIRLAPLDYTALVWALIIGTVAFGEIPTLAALTGGALIIAAAVAAGRRKA